MPRRLVRLVLAIATTLAAWLVVMPARASAPFCDDRGASTFAPAPVLESPEASIDVGAEDEGCLDGLASPNALDEGRAPSISDAPSALATTLPPRLRLGAPPFAILAAPSARLDVPRAGVHDRVDRPPRP